MSRVWELSGSDRSQARRRRGFYGLLPQNMLVWRRYGRCESFESKQLRFGTPIAVKLRVDAGLNVSIYVVNRDPVPGMCRCCRLSDGLRHARYDLWQSKLVV